jgi:hypothetical protein
MSNYPRSVHKPGFGVFLGFTLVSISNLIGMAALWYLGEHKFFQPYDPGYEGTLVLLLLVGSVWAGIAVYLTLRSYTELVRHVSIPSGWAALGLSVSTLPISLVINHPGYSVNPMGLLFGGKPPAYQACVVEYLVLTLLSGIALARIARSSRFPGGAIASATWYILAIFYLIQLPLKVVLSRWAYSFLR